METVTPLSCETAFLRSFLRLLTYLDGVETLLRCNNGCGNEYRLDMIYKALLRPGRIDRIIYVPLPDKEARKDIFKIHLAKTPLANDVVLQDLAERTEIFSGAEILFCVAKQR